MGTDIHAFVEKRTSSGWVLPEGLVENGLWYSGNPLANQQFRPKSLFIQRNYALFAILANVRNPLSEVERFGPISRPRGLPQDVSTEVLAWYRSFGDSGDCHSASWLLLRELNEFDWDQSVVRRSFVDNAIAHLFARERRGFPGRDELPEHIPPTGQWAEVKWIETYREAVGSDFFDKTVTYMRSLGGADEIRMVFWFDS